MKALGFVLRCKETAQSWIGTRTLTFLAGAFFMATILCCDTPAQTSVKIYPQTIRIQKGKSRTITAVAYNSPSQPVLNATFTFTNGNPSLAGITNTLITGDDITTPLTPPRNLRTISGLSGGTTSIVATWNGINSAPATVIVDDTAQTPTAIVNGDNGTGTTINTKVGEPIEVDAEASRGVEKIEWNWGDGDTTTELLSATHAYLVAGTYNLRLTVTNSTGQTATRLITVNVANHAPPTRTINVTTLQQLLNAYNTATGGEHIVIPAGTQLNGEIVLPARNFSDYVTIRSSAAMPDIRDRVSPTQTGLVTIKATSVNGTPFTINKGASKIRIIGIKFEPRYLLQGSIPAAYYLAQIGEAFTQNNVSENPTKIIMQHCVVNPPNDVNVVHAVLNDGYKVSIISSWLGNIKTYDGTDSQAAISFDGRGAHVYNNNYLEASAENVMYGGVQPSIPEIVSTNIEFRRNHFIKRLAWRVYNGQSHLINAKNLFESKNARRIYFEGNVFDNHWDGARGQRFAFAIMSSTSPGSPGEFVPWAVSEDIIWENNRLKGAFGGFNTGVVNDGIEPFHGLKPTNIVIKNMLFEDISNRWGAPGNQYGSKLIQPNNVEDFRFDHVTLIDRDNTLDMNVFYATGNNYRFAITNSILTMGQYGLRGSNVGGGFNALNPGTDNLSATVCSRPANATWKLTNNVMPRFNVDVTCYPSTGFQNSYPNNYTNVGFVNYTTGNYQLATSSPYRNTASDGTDPGVNYPVLVARTSCAVSGQTANCLGPVSNVSYSVSGRISENNGRSVYLARVAITDSSTGAVQYAMSNSFGYFRFPYVSAGNYIVSVVSKNRTFTPLPTTISANVSNLDFIFNR